MCTCPVFLEVFLWCMVSTSTAIASAHPGAVGTPPPSPTNFNSQQSQPTTKFSLASSTSSERLVTVAGVCVALARVKPRLSRSNSTFAFSTDLMWFSFFLLTNIYSVINSGKYFCMKVKKDTESVRDVNMIGCEVFGKTFATFWMALAVQNFKDDFFSTI